MLIVLESGAPNLSLLLELNLERLKWKLLNHDEAKLLTPEILDIAEREYKRFLTIKLIYPDEAIAPTKLMDMMWHAHILDTRNYARDCDTIFGNFVNHQPYFGPFDSKKNQRKITRSYENMMRIYMQLFGEHPALDAMPQEHPSCSCGDNEVACGDD
jgi:hypothetical protein